MSNCNFEQQLSSVVFLHAQVLEQAWPFFGMYMEKLLKGNIQQAVRMSSSALKMFTFNKVHFGRVVSWKLVQSSF